MTETILILQPIAAELRDIIRNELPDGFALSFPPPAIPGVGTSGGFTFVLEDRAGKDVQFLADNVNKFMAAAQKRKELAGMVSTFLPAVPQQFIEVDDHSLTEMENCP